MLTDTMVQELRVTSPNLDQWTLRASKYGALDAFMAQTNESGGIISRELLAQAATAVGRDVKVPVFDSETVSLGSTRSVTIADSENTSKFYTVSFSIISFGFTMVPASHMNNEIEYREDFGRKYMKYHNQVHKHLDNLCLSALDANKTQVFGGGGFLGKYSQTANVVLSPYALRDEIISDASVLMEENDYYAETGDMTYRLIGNSGLKSRFNLSRQHGLYNDKNQFIEYDDKTLHFTNRLTNAATHIATGYIVNPGAVGMLWRHERESILGTALPDGTAWGQSIMPGVGVPMDTYFYYSVGDQSAFHGGTPANLADLTRGAKEHHGFAIEVATVVAYNTDLAANASPIMKLAIVEES